MGREAGSPWAGHQSITGPQIDTQPFTLGVVKSSSRAFSSGRDAWITLGCSKPVVHIEYILAWNVSHTCYIFVPKHGHGTLNALLYLSGAFRGQVSLCGTSGWCTIIWCHNPTVKGCFVSENSCHPHQSASTPALTWGGDNRQLQGHLSLLEMGEREVDGGEGGAANWWWKRDKTGIITKHERKQTVRWITAQEKQEKGLTGRDKRRVMEASTDIV